MVTEWYERFLLIEAYRNKIFLLIEAERNEKFLLMEAVWNGNMQL